MGDALKKTGAGENTLVVFTSDNGGERFSDSWPLVGGKMDLLDGVSLLRVLEQPLEVALAGG